MAKKKEPKLKVTGLTKLPLDYKGEPCVLMLEITDVEGGCYESEIHMDNGYSEKNLLDAAVQTFKMCDSLPERVNIRSIRIKK